MPTNIAGWGPREGVAAWAFGVAGPGAGLGVATAVVFGVMVLVASLRGPACWSWTGPLATGRPGAAWPRPPRVWPMAERPYTLLSCGMSIDGYLDARLGDRLLLSNDADLDRVDAVGPSDAILVGAGRSARTTRGCWSGPRRAGRSGWPAEPPTPIKVTVRVRGLDPTPANFFRIGDCEKLVYCASRWSRGPATGWGRWRRWSTAASR